MENETAFLGLYDDKKTKHPLHWYGGRDDRYGGGGGGHLPIFACFICIVRVALVVDLCLLADALPPFCSGGCFAAAVVLVITSGGCFAVLLGWVDALPPCWVGWILCNLCRVVDLCTLGVVVSLSRFTLGKWYNLAIDHNISWFVVNKLCYPLDKLIWDIALVKKKKRTKPCILNNFPVLRSQRIQNRWKVRNWKPSESIFRSFDRIIVLVLLNSKEWKQYKKKRRKSWTLNRSKQHSEIRLKMQVTSRVRVIASFLFRIFSSVYWATVTGQSK